MALPPYNISWPRMRWRKSFWDVVWNSLIAMALMTTLLPFFSYENLGSQRWRSSLFNEWEVSTARYPHLLDGVSKMRELEPPPLDLWVAPQKGWGACSEILSSPSKGIGTGGYLQVFLDGGLNQQRMGVCDAVALAKILNLTLVLPHFDVNSVWQDRSVFADIFDLDHFLRSVENDVHIVTELPSEFSWSSREYYATGFRETRIKDAPAQGSHLWYKKRVLPLIEMYGIVAIAPFTHRLGFEDLPSSIQKLRCRVNFMALRFKPAIRTLGDRMIQRLQGTSPWEVPRNRSRSVYRPHNRRSGGVAKYLALHLRFDKDMAAHSACDFGGGRAEDLALSKYRRQLWHAGVKNDIFTVDELREKGKCPLTPEEVGIMLAGLGFPENTVVYLASYKVYGGEARMSHLRSLFPFLVDKYSLASNAEILPFKGKSSQLAALDYYVSFHSDAFLSASRGNMHNALLGHRAYEHDGLTIRADMVLLAQLFGNKSLTWDQFQVSLRDGHSNRKGQIILRKSTQSIYTYPAPDCMCPLEIT